MKFENGYGESTFIVYCPLFGEQTSIFFRFFSSSLNWKKGAQFQKNRGIRVDMEGRKGMDGNRFSISNMLVCSMVVYYTPHGGLVAQWWSNMHRRGGQINKRNTYVIVERPLIFIEKKLHFSLNSFAIDKV